MKKFYAKQVILLAGIILIFTLTGCPNSNDENSTVKDGILTLTDIPVKYNGKYLFLDGGSQDIYIGGFNNYNEKTNELTLVPISNRRANIPLWTVKNYDNEELLIKKYTGNHTFELLVRILEDKQNDNMIYEDVMEFRYFESITFKNGGTVISWNEGEEYENNEGVTSTEVDAYLQSYYVSTDIAGTQIRLTISANQMTVRKGEHQDPYRIEFNYISKDRIHNVTNWKNYNSEIAAINSKFYGTGNEFTAYNAPSLSGIERAIIGQMGVKKWEDGSDILTSNIVMDIDRNILYIVKIIETGNTSGLDTLPEVGTYVGQ